MTQYEPFANFELKGQKSFSNYEKVIGTSQANAIIFKDYFHLTFILVKKRQSNMSHAHIVILQQSEHKHFISWEATGEQLPMNLKNKI